MVSAMTLTAQRNQVLLAIRSCPAPSDDVMDLELIAPATVLAFPAVPLQYCLFQLTVPVVIEPKPAVLAHANFLTLFRNLSCCCGGKNPKNLCIDMSSAAGSPLSRFAPARKSAQIISRQ